MPPRVRHAAVNPLDTFLLQLRRLRMVFLFVYSLIVLRLQEFVMLLLSRSTFLLQLRGHRMVYLFVYSLIVFLLVPALILINIERLQNELGELHGAEVLAAGVVVLQFLQFILHHLRFRRSHWLFQWGAWAAYYVPMPLAALAVGMMLRLRRPFWPVAVLFAAGQSDTMAAYSLDDDSQNMRRFVRRTLYLAYLIVALLQFQQGASADMVLDYYSLFAGFVVFLVHLKVSSMAMVSSGDICMTAAEAASSRCRSAARPGELGGGDICVAAAEAASSRCKSAARPGELGRGDICMAAAEAASSRYKSAAPGELGGAVVALGPLESCPSAIAGSTTYDDILAMEYSDKLQDVCFSSALFLQLLQRNHGPHQRVDTSTANSAFRKLILTERDHGSSASRKLLLAEGDDDTSDYARALKLVEVQLSLMYDHLFSAHGSPSSVSYKLYWDHWVFKIGFLMHTLSLVYYPKSNVNVPPPEQQEEHHGGGAFAVGVVYLLVMLELCQLVHYFTSDRFLVSYVCDRARALSQSQARRTSSKPPHMVVLNAMVETRGTWQSTLGQYSLVEHYSGCSTTSVGQRFMGRILHHHGGRPQRGNPASPVPLSMDQVKAWIFKKVDIVTPPEPSSVSSPPTTASSQSVAPSSPLHWKKYFPDQLSCAFSQETETHTILIWHIATWICSMRFLSSSADYMAATKLSNYCAYLVAFRPELLPGHHAVAKRIFDKAIREAEDRLQGETTPYGRYTKFDQDSEQRKLSPDDPLVGILERGDELAQKLKVIDNKDGPRYCWAIIADFWALMMLHLALSGNPTAHIEHLAKGGEFVTRLWALLSNAGIQQNTMVERKNNDGNKAQGKRASNGARCCIRSLIRVRQTRCPATESLKLVSMQA